MNTPDTFSDQLPLRKQILHVLSLLKKATPDEVTMELMELKGIAAKDAVRELTVETTDELKKMAAEKLIQPEYAGERVIYHWQQA